MFARLLSGVVLGVEARLIEIQCDVSGGLPTFNIVGLPEKEVSESRERIRSAIKIAGFSFPAGRITANLAPADLRKEGVGFDLPIAVAILIATGQIAETTERNLLLGELALNGEVRGVRGVLPIALETSNEIDGLIVPQDNALEAAVATDKPVYPVQTLLEVQRFLNREITIAPVSVDRNALRSMEQPSFRHELAEVRGQLQAKRALEVAAAGGHNLLMIGPPGSGKSLLARCMPDLLPALSFHEALEVTRIYSTAGMLERGASLVWRRPYRAPHHTISYAGMVGGGHGVPGPGEISLAHHGVLFLDELPEFDRRVLETLRQPLEDRSILISRAGISVRFPSAFTLVAAMNPCPCGFLGDPIQACTCSMHDIRRYRKRLSGPFLDRIDLCVEVPRVPADDLFGTHVAESSARVHDRVARAREIQWDRMREDEDCHSNAQLDGERLETDCILEESAQQLLRRAVTRFGLSARAHVRIRRVARTIADLANSSVIRAEHIAEAIQLRTAGEAVADF
ncbi:YifB family Mg chelatase-like AAA ATPase [Candidatus Bipolaricaulota bacterium]|nr:YifB family Mg chelatase-like AAA ATPase [Candidatus Bipolaricaulota bacterium]